MCDTITEDTAAYYHTAMSTEPPTQPSRTVPSARPNKQPKLDENGYPIIPPPTYAGPPRGPSKLSDALPWGSHPLRQAPCVQKSLGWGGAAGALFGAHRYWAKGKVFNALNSGIFMAAAVIGVQYYMCTKAKKIEHARYVQETMSQLNAKTAANKARRRQQREQQQQQE